MLHNCRAHAPAAHRSARAPANHQTTVSPLLLIFIKAVLAGFAIAAPVGPVGVMCVRRTLRFGRAAGLSAGLGAALADAVFGVIAAFGVAAVQDWMLAHMTMLQLTGGALLLALALRIWLRHEHDRSSGSEPRTHLAAFALTFALTITNPITILAFAAVFTTLGLGVSGIDLASAAVLVGGVYVGSALWWIGLALSANLLRDRLSADIMLWLDRSAAVVLAGFGTYALIAGLT